MNTQRRQGFFYALCAFLIWGMAPVYFKSIQQIPSGEILSHRVIWSFFFMILLITSLRYWHHIKQACKQKQKLLALAGTATLIGSNWLIYIWAINNNQMLEASLGYFVNPLINVVFGMLFLGERFRRLQWIAVSLALTGVLIQLWQFGSVPIIGLSLAVTFALYGLLHKKIGIGAQTGILFETLWLLPFALIYLFLFTDSSTSHFLDNPLSLNLLLVFAGVITTVPLLCFTTAASQMRLSTLGFFQYLSPTLMFILAVFVYGEKFSADKLITFSFIWTALALFILDALYTQRKLR